MPQNSVQGAAFYEKACAQSQRSTKLYDVADESGEERAVTVARIAAAACSHLGRSTGVTVAAPREHAPCAHVISTVVARMVRLRMLVDSRSIR